MKDKKLITYMIKGFTIAILVASYGTLQAESGPHGRDHGHRPPPPPHHGSHHHHDHHDVDYYDFSCAPEVVEGNLKATERVLKEASESEAFANEVKFQKQLEELSNPELETQAKINILFKDLGISPENYEEIYAFVGAREVPIKAVDALRENLEMSKENAELLAGKVQKALLGSMNQ